MGDWSGKRVIRLVFDQDNGDFLGVEDCEQGCKEPEKLAALDTKIKDSDGEEIMVRDALQFPRKKYTVKLIDEPGHSICWVRCGGRLYRVC